MANETVKMVKKIKNLSLTMSFVVGRVESTDEMDGNMLQKHEERKKARKLEGFLEIQRSESI